MQQFEKVFYKYRIVYLIFASLMIVTFYNNYWIYLFFTLLTCIFCVTITKLDFCHPYCNIVPIFTLYQISFPILNHYGIKVFENIPINDFYYIYSWLALILFITFLGNLKNIGYKKDSFNIETKNKILLLLYIFLSIVAVASSIFVIYKGYSSKYELSKNLNLLIRCGMMAYVGIIPVTLFCYFNKTFSNKSRCIVVIVSFLMMAFGMMTMGERSYIFNYIMIAFLIFMAFYKISFKKKVIIVLIMALFVANSSNLKMFFSRNNIYTDNKREDNIVLRFLNSDFASAGFNFNYLLVNCENYNKFYGTTYIYDILSPVDDVLPIVKKLNVNRWYQDTFWKTRKTGLGFSLVGEGFVNFGFLGIVLSMYILGKLTRFFYINSTKNAYYFIFYLAFINNAMYACRGSLANIISPLFKYYVLLSIFIYVIYYIKINNWCLYYKNKKIYSIKRSNDVKKVI